MSNLINQHSKYFYDEKAFLLPFFAAIAFFAAMPATAQTADADYNLYGHLVGVNENNGIYKFTTEATSPLTAVQKIPYSPDYGIVKVKDRYFFLRARRLGLRCRNVYVHLQRQRFYFHHTP